MGDDNRDLDAELRALLTAGRKIEAIKRYREATGADLAAAKNTVEALEKDQALAACGPLDSGLESEIVSLLQGGHKIDAIKLLRERCGIGLKEAKDAVEALAAKEGLPASKSGCAGVVLLAVILVATLIGIGL